MERMMKTLQDAQAREGGALGDKLQMGYLIFTKGGIKGPYVGALEQVRRNNMARIVCALLPEGLHLKVLHEEELELRDKISIDGSDSSVRVVVFAVEGGLDAIVQACGYNATYKSGTVSSKVIQQKVKDDEKTVIWTEPEEITALPPEVPLGV